MKHWTAITTSAAAILFSLGIAGAQDNAAKPEYGTVTGVVINALAQSPLAGVTVSANGSTVTTDVHGQFALPRLEPGRQWISANDNRRAFSTGVYALVIAGQETAVEIYAKPGGTISGKVLDEEQKPVAGAAVLLLEKKFEHGEAAYDRQLTSTTGDAGEFRLAPVRAERNYLILVKKPLTLAANTAATSAARSKRARVLVPTYYPNSPDAQGAQPVMLAPGENHTGVEIKMPAADSFCLDGKLEVPTGIRPTSVTITEHMSLLAGSTFTAARIETKPAGDFGACGLHPGDYFMAARSGQTSNPPPADSVSAFKQITVIDADLHDLKLLAHPPTAISGDATWDPAPSGKAAETPVQIGVTESLPLDDQVDQAGRYSSFAAMFWFGDRFPVPGPFTLSRLPAGGTYQFGAANLPSDCYTKEASLGSANLQEGLLRTMDGTAAGRIRLVLACDGSFLTARVSDSEGNPVSHVQLYVMPSDAPSEAALSRRIHTGEVENGWSGSIGPLPPGKYLVLASELELDGTAEPVIKLWQARSKAIEVEVGPHAQVTTNLVAVE